MFVCRGRLEEGSLACLYPGAVYQPQDPVLLQSVANQFILRCCDGVLLDGNNRGLSPLIFRSCTGRDQVMTRVVSSAMMFPSDRNVEGGGHQLAHSLACQPSLCGAGWDQHGFTLDTYWGYF